MPNFAVAAKQETIDRANAVIEQYRRHGEKNEAVLLRIIELAATYQKQLRDADKENAKLSVEIEQLREQLEKA